MDGRSIWAVALMLLAVSVAAAVGCLMLRSRWRRQEEFEKTLLEVLKSYQKGDYKTDFLERLPDGKQTHNHRHLEINDALRGLGYYLRDTRERLEREENSIKSLITDISHQLKTPFAALRIDFDLLEDPSLTTAERETLQSAAKKDIARMERLIDDLMRLSRMEHHMIEMYPEYTSLRETLSEAVGKVFAKARQKEIRIEADLPSDALVLHDRKWTAEAVANVLDNGIKYSDKGTVVTLRMKVCVRLVMIDVEDEGMGIPEEELHLIFQRFYRGKKSCGVAEGAGVGLYLTRLILEEQGGVIMAKRKARGTLFRMTLPL